MLMMQQVMGVMRKMLNKKTLNFYFSMFTCLIFTFSQNVELKVLLATPLFDVLCRNIPTETVESGFYARFL